jgi:predicted O-linked N-acetylglucosamine transferase (SPINDLY family)
MAEDRFGEGLAAHRAGLLGDAARLYGRVLAHDPAHAGALHMLGVVRLAEGRFEEAAGLIGRSLAIEPGFAGGHFNHGCALQSLGRPADAAAAYERAIARDPTHAGAQLNLSGVLLQLARPKDAFEAARRAAELAPSLAAPYCNAGLALKAAGDVARAETMFREAIKRDPTHAESLYDLGNLLRQQPDRVGEARAILSDLVRIRPDMIAPRIAVAQLLRDSCEGAAAADVLEAAAAISPDDPLVRLALAMAPLQALYRTEAERDDARVSYAAGLERFDAWARAGGSSRLAVLADAAGMVQPFYLPYQGGVDRDLQRLYGTLMTDAAAARFGEGVIAPPPAPGETIRIGFVSGYMRDHSVWKIPLRGWIEGLDRSRFTIFGYYTGEITHAQTRAARAACARFVQGPKTTAQWRAEILADRPHVLIYPELGMDGAAFRLACLRLAPLQCVGPGHPVTSGLPTMDLFLSSDAMEPADADEHYTEALIRLPGIGFDYAPLPASASTVSEAVTRDIPAGTWFFCGQSLFKYLPGYDRILARIAAIVPDARFIFVDAPAGGQLRSLMRLRMSESLDVARHCVMLGRLDRDDFVALSGACDVVLDGTDWSGCNSTLEGLPFGTPIVTLPGRTMRARHTAAILTEIGETTGLAADEDAYVARAAELAADPALRDRIRAALKAGWSRACGDRRSTRALEDALALRLRG